MQEIVKEYLKYLREWAKVRHRQNFAFPLSFERFRAEVEREEREDARNYESHVRCVTAQWRFA